MNTTISHIDTSEFVTSRHISATELAPNEVIQVRWAPDRRCHFRHLGEGRFVVDRSENSKLAEGDTFCCLIFALGQPMYLDHVMHLGQGPALYVAGKCGGLTEVSLLDGETLAPVVVLPEVDDCLRRAFPQRFFGLTPEGANHTAAPFAEALSNAVRCGLLHVVDCQLHFPTDCPEQECGHIVHRLKSFYSFSNWGELERIIRRPKPDGTFVKSLRQLRTFHPKDTSNHREAELDRILFGQK